MVAGYSFIAEDQSAIGNFDVISENPLMIMKLDYENDYRSGLVFPSSMPLAWRICSTSMGSTSPCGLMSTPMNACGLCTTDR